MLKIKIFILFFFFVLIDQLAAKTDSYRAIWSDNPSNNITISWNKIDGKESIFYYDTLSNIKLSDKSSKKIIVPIENKFKGMKNCFVRLDNLLPNTIYYFIIKDENSESDVMSFKTLPKENFKLSIIAGGDSRNHRKNRCKANALVSKLRPDFVMFGGDMTGLDGSSSWKKWMKDWQLTIGKDGRLTPIVVARGNHERSNKVLKYLFDLPEKNYYSTKIGKDFLNIITLNSMISASGEQKSWLQNELKTSNTYTWHLAQYHHPIRPHTYNKSEKYSQQQHWAPLFYQYNMDLVIECDAHVVKTTYPIRPSKDEGSDEGFIIDREKGTVYIGEGCWGAPLRNNNDNKNWTRASGSFNQFKWMIINQEKLEIRTIKTDNSEEVGRLYDDNKFEFPSNLQVWKPDTGPVITLFPRKKNEMNVTKDFSSDVSALGMNETDSNKIQGWKLTLFFFLPLLILMIFPLLPNYIKIKLFNKSENI